MKSSRSTNARGVWRSITNTSRTPSAISGAPPPPGRRTRGRVVVADHGAVQVAVPVDLRGAEEADVDPAALEPVREHLRAPRRPRRRSRRARRRRSRAAAVPASRRSCRSRRRARSRARASAARGSRRGSAGRSRRSRRRRRGAAGPPRRPSSRRASYAVAVRRRRPPSRLARYSPTSAVPSTCSSHPRGERVAVAADRVPARRRSRCRARSSRARTTGARRPARRATASTTQRGSTTPPGRGSSSSTISSTVTIERADASTVSFCTPMIPQSWTLPRRSACCAWTIPTSGRCAGTAASSSPVNGHAIGATRVRAGRSPPRVAAQHAERQVRGAGRVRGRHPGVRVLLELERRAASRARPRRAAGGASRRPGCRPTRRRASRAQPIPMSWS